MDEFREFRDGHGAVMLRRSAVIAVVQELVGGELDRAAGTHVMLEGGQSMHFTGGRVYDDVRAWLTAAA